MDRFLTDIALQRAELYEKQGNKAKAEYYLTIAEKVEKIYGKIEKAGGGLNEEFRSYIK